jgi:hypothetical protein
MSKANKLDSYKTRALKGGKGFVNLNLISLPALVSRFSAARGQALGE